MPVNFILPTFFWHLLKLSVSLQLTYSTIQWKTDDDDDADFSFEPSGNNFSQSMDFKPVVVPEWKERNIEFWDKNIGISETEGAASMQV